MKSPVNDLSFDYVDSRLTYNPETGALTFKPKSADCGEIFWRRWNARYANKPAGSFLRVSVGKGERKTRKDYCRVHLGTRDYLAHRIAWLLYYGEWPPNDIDHINGDSTDNRIANLRSATKSENHGNRGRSRSNTSGYKGVSLFKNGQWYAQLTKNNRHVLAKLFDDKEEAARAYDAAAITHFGEFAQLNFPREAI